MAQSSVAVRKEVGEIAKPESTRGGIYFTPRVDIYETAEEVVLLCDIPGVKPADVDIKFDKGELDLHARVMPRFETTQFLAEEYGIGDFYRTFAISSEIDSEKINAEFRDGVLTIHLPKQEKAKPKRIEVKAG
jgi:HSP20 family protein